MMRFIYRPAVGSGKQECRKIRQTGQFYENVHLMNKLTRTVRRITTRRAVKSTGLAPPLNPLTQQRYRDEEAEAEKSCRLESS